MSDTLTNALAQAGRSSSVLSGIANPAVVNPLAGYGSAISAVQGIQDLQQRQQTLSQNQQTQRLQKLNYTAGTLADLLNQPGQITSDQVRAAAMQHVGDGITDENTVNQVLSTMPQNTADNPNAVRGWVRQLQIANLGHQQQIMAGFNPVTYNLGGTAVTRNEPTMPGVGGANAPAYTQATTASPDTVISLPDVVVKATQADVQAGLATTPGQEIRISGAEAKRRQDSGLLPPNAIVRTPPTTGGGGGVVDSNGNRVSPTNQPRLNVTPPASTTSQPAAPTATAPLPVPPIPPQPPNATPAPANTPAQAQAIAVAQAKASGRPVPIANGGGLVANPDGTIGTPGGGFRPPAPAPAATPAPAPAPVPSAAAPATPTPPPSVNAPRDSMMPGPRAALQGGVPVASANALQVPNVGPAGPPNALVPGDVNAIMQGINRARATPATGTQQAVGGSGSFAAGPGYDEQVNATTSQERLAADTKIATNYAANVFPYTQALSTLGRGMTTAPGSDFLNAAKGFAGGMARSMGFGGTFDSTKDYDELHKWLSQIVTNNPVAQGSDARLAATLSGNANTGIHELASADMMKAGTALMRMNATASSEWANNPQVRAQYGYYNDFLRDFNKNVDPRAFAWDMYNPEQKKTLLADIDSHDEAYAQKFLSSRNMAQRNGYLGETRAMP